MLNTIDLSAICTTSILITVGIIGVTQLLKNFFASRKGKKFAVVSTVLTAILCLLNSSLVPSGVTVLVDTFVLSLAVTQLAWDVLVQAIPAAVESLFDKMLSSVKEKAKTKNSKEK